ncbi:hypothetical protein RHECNPAF_890096 [Rhizobium etli CNPAF512]|nr:hypothetical protein RHECNPAF_890096 [Rhizobium etli CNPAF512]
MKPVAGPALTTSDQAKIQRQQQAYEIIASLPSMTLAQHRQRHIRSPPQILTAPRMVFQIERGLPMASPQKNRAKVQGHADALAFSSWRSA